MKKVEIQGKVTIVGEGAFEECGNLKEISFPSGLETIGENAFIFSGLEKIELPDTVKEMDYEAFKGTPWENNKKTSKELTIVNDMLLYGGETSGKVEIPKCVRVICDNAFSSNEKITEVVIPGSVEVIDAYAFEDCTKLESVNIENGVKYIKDSAFFGTSISNITIPESVEEIENCAFSVCEDLKKVVIHNKKCKIDDLGVSYDPAKMLKAEIHGYKGSTAHRYAIKENLKFKKLKK